MKNIILLIAVMVVSACASMPTMKSMAGIYEAKISKDSFKTVFLGTGKVEIYYNDIKINEGDWSVVGREVHAESSKGETGILRINSKARGYSTLTDIASIVDGKRIDLPKEEQLTYKKIK